MIDRSDCTTSATKFSNGARIIWVCFQDVRYGSPSEESCGFYDNNKIKISRIIFLE